MFSRFDKAHAAAIAAAACGLLAAMVPDMPDEVIAGVTAAVTWLLTYAIPNKA